MNLLHEVLSRSIIHFSFLRLLYITDKLCLIIIILTVIYLSCMKVKIVSFLPRVLAFIKGSNNEGNCALWLNSVLCTSRGDLAASFNMRADYSCSLCYLQ